MTQPSERLLFDAGALLLAERDPNGRVWAACEAEYAHGRRPLLPVLVLGQTWRGGGGRQFGLARVVKACEIVEVDTVEARRIGSLLGAAGTGDVVDASVVLAAGDHDATVWTSDPDDIAHLASAADIPLSVVRV